jgi:glutathione peroxidase-family protein
MSHLYDFTMKSITGEDVSFAAFRDKVLLIVNVASY